MAASTIPVTHEKRLIEFSALVNKLKRIGVLTDALVTASTSVADLIADIYAALVSGTIPLYGPEVKILVRRLEQHIKFMEKKGLIDDTIAAALTTVNTASAATDLRYLVSSVIQQSGYDPTTENSADLDGNFSYATTS